MVGGEKETLIARLAEYENTGKTPEEIRGFEETARKMVERTISLHRELKAEQSKDEWIPVCEKLPELETWVLATVKRHRWISDYKEEYVPDDEKQIIRKQSMLPWQSEMLRVGGTST